MASVRIPGPAPALPASGTPWLLTVGAQAVAFASLLVASPATYARWTAEDRGVEWLTVAFLLASALLLVPVALREGARLRRLAYAGAALAFLLAAGEEISWGQRLLGIETPEAWAAINAQQETNLHNLDVRSFNNAWQAAVYLLAALTLALAALRRTTLLGFPLPSLPLAFAFVLVLVHRSHTELVGIGLHDLADGACLALVAFHGVRALRAGDRATAAGALAVGLGVPALIALHHAYSPGVPLNSISEVQEYLLAFVSLGYAAALLGRARSASLARPVAATAGRASERLAA